jgi:prepilin-type N-terminal cleavage/methylation domain-containing protein/prepilin-type processing-associated H-X9-DG protein
MKSEMKYTKVRFMTKRSVGFTLIEMLVVIALLLILGAMIYPAISKIRESGRATACSSNLRQLQLAVLGFSGSSGGAIPKAVSSRLGPDPLTGAYTEDKGWVCWFNWTPSATPGVYAQAGAGGAACITNGTLYPFSRSRDIYMCPSFKSLSAAYSTYTRSYSMNSSVSGTSILAGRPTALVLFGDDSGCTVATADSQFGTNEVYRIHGGGKAQVVYLDGHVEKW